ncbi:MULTISPECIES: hypothetical protein [unclassified Lysinibacillus]|uniref:hypothetical protein n=1 Tax=unclassified Lysinibacillus TaxID=2636778 RepID=UPI0011131E16|nr:MULTISPECIES: hypothetical protein [unclassified Lysinibacillus]
MSKKEKFLRTGFNMGLQQTQKSKGKFDATVDVAKNTYNDVKKLVTDPIGVVKETTDSLKNFASHPLLAVKTIAGSIKDSIEKDVIHGNNYSRAYWGTKVTLNTATAVVGTKGVGTLTKVGKTSTGVTSVKSTTSSSSSKGTDKVEISYPLSSTNKKHINKHNIESLKQQSKYLSDSQLADKLESSFFNPKWSKDDINKYAEIAYNDLKSQGKTGNLTYEIGGEIIDVFIHPDGQFGSVYGRHKFTVEDIRKMTK